MASKFILGTLIAISLFIPGITLSQEVLDSPETAEPEAPDRDKYVGYFEWASIRVGGGNYGGVLSSSMFTFRWRWIYWTILNIAGGGGAPGGNDRFEMGYFGRAGTRVGVPFHFGPGGMHEIRGGLGISGGIVQLEAWRTWWQVSKMWYCTSHGPFLDAELVYHFHMKKRFAVIVGYEGTFVFNYVNDNGYPNDYWQPENVHTGFLGIAI